MTRHTRNRQRRLAAEMETGLNHDFFMKDKNLTIARYRNALTGRELDVTFKWIRTKRHNFVYDEVNGITEYLVDKNVISWVSRKGGQLLKNNMNPKGSSVMSYRIGTTI
ncbi:hypothetical protein [Bacillus phage Hakuna]|uniref:Uncharacterized protein n=2 Tax=Wphvirus hakuna TaxID=1987729 RepID=A0A222Z1F2_9CAUD|nr:hypothetical protein FP72_gp018 [Bacillus phage Hakuna]YP_009279188.1 hypothetical protein BIZ89_gp021 [Bacillus phage Kida]ASR78392.1 hypothetical protein PPISBEST_21 [Bacillus phage PPIsBest]QDH49294.1 hypothetical protein PHIREBALL_19 [Bacillus phage Phireball]ULF48933.1 hypothetical protein [Bacillus phage Darren]ULF49228.1 hypothetical protein [Bacillus phage MrBubbles]AHZ10036.1 hypothetical protein [Bacillus phage Hakuna]